METTTTEVKSIDREAMYLASCEFRILQMRFACFVADCLCLLTNIVVLGILTTGYPIPFYILFGTSWRSRSSSIVSNSCSNGCMATFYVVCWYNANIDATLMIELSICVHGRTHNFAELCLFAVTEMRSSSYPFLCDGSSILFRSVAVRCDGI